MREVRFTWRQNWSSTLKNKIISLEQNTDVPQKISSSLCLQEEHCAKRFMFKKMFVQVVQTSKIQVHVSLHMKLHLTCNLCILCSQHCCYSHIYTWITCHHSIIFIVPQIKRGNSLFLLLGCLIFVVFLCLNDLWKDRGVVQRGDVPQVASVLHGDLSQDSPHDFSRACFRKTLHNLKEESRDAFTADKT